MRVDFYPIHSHEHYLKYVVIQVRAGDRWVFVRHEDRTSWEMVGGHIEQGEAPNEAAYRELVEESGAVKFHIFPVCDYSVTRDGESLETASYGRLYVADVYEFGTLEYEIEEIKVMDELPKVMTYEKIQPFLFKRICEYLDKRGKLVQLSDFSKVDHPELVSEVKTWFEDKVYELAYIGSATDGDRTYYHQAVEKLKAYGKFRCKYYDFDKEYWQGQEDEIVGADVVYLSGGETSYFLEGLRGYGMLKKLRGYYYKGGIIIGVSAGAIMMADDITISKCDPRNKSYSEDWKSLDLVTYDFVPHWNVDKGLVKAYLNYKKLTWKDVYTVCDGSGIIVDDCVKIYGDISRLEEEIKDLEL